MDLDRYINNLATHVLRSKVKILFSGANCVIYSVRLVLISVGVFSLCQYHS